MEGTGIFPLTPNSGRLRAQTISTCKTDTEGSLPLTQTLDCEDDLNWYVHYIWNVTSLP
jgi:hypothetical protein